MGFLDPYRVLDLTDERGLLAGRMFADLGAEVVQVEPLAGSPARRLPPLSDSGSSYFWETYSTNKRGISCDLDSEEGAALLRRLASVADFLFVSEDPGVMERRGLSYSALAEVNPSLIYVSITPFGSEGPKAGYVANDLAIWASSGALYYHRQEDRPPVRISVPQSFLHAAGDAANAALIAHFDRLRTGSGQRVDISAQQSCTQATLSGVLSFAVGDADFRMSDDRPRTTSGQSQQSPVSGSKDKLDLSISGSATGRSKWEAADGYFELHLAMGPRAGTRTNRLFAWMYAQHLCDEEVAAIDWVSVPEQLTAGTIDPQQLEVARDVVRGFFAKTTKRELMDLTLELKLFAGPIFTTADLAHSPQFESREFWWEAPGGDGSRYKMPGPFRRESRLPPSRSIGLLPLLAKTTRRSIASGSDWSRKISTCFERRR